MLKIQHDARVKNILTFSLIVVTNEPLEISIWILVWKFIINITTVELGYNVIKGT
jgi:hypothetical protein